MKMPAFLLASLLSAACLVAQVSDQSQPAAAQPSQSSAGNDIAIQLAAARKQLAILRARHGENHPTVQKQLRTVTELQKRHADAARQAEKAPTPEDRAEQLEAAKRELAMLRVRYTDSHPEVKRQLQKIAGLEAAK